MNFKRPKQEILDEVMIRVQDAMRGSLHSALDVYNHPDRNMLVNSVAYATSYAVSEAFQAFIDSIYTDEQFEEDMGLREKDNAIK